MHWKTPRAASGVLVASVLACAMAGGPARSFELDDTGGAAVPEPGDHESAAPRPGVCWSEPYDLDLPKVSSEIVPGLFATELADDFAMPPHSEVLINKVRWWGGPYEPTDEGADEFKVSIYRRAGLKPALTPLLTIEDLHPEGALVGFDPFGGPTFEFEVDVEIPLTVTWDPVFYLVVQAEHSFPVPQWGMQGSENSKNSLPYFRGAFFGFPRWTLYREIVEYLYGAAFELECENVETGGTFTASTFEGEGASEAGGGAPRIAGIHPNPVRDRATIELDLHDDGPVALRIFDVTGREVGAVDAGPPGAGRRVVTWIRDRRAVRAGVHFLRLALGDHAETRKLLVID